MSFKMFTRTRPALLVAALACLFAAPAARAQEEGVPKVVDEVIAQVNTEVITLSMVRREMAEAAAALQQQKGLTPEQAQAEIAKRQIEIIATLVNEQLLLQKGKELGLADNVEREVNERMVAVMKQEGFKTIEQLETAMRESKVDPAAIRQSLRAELMKQAVFQSEVDAKLYWGLTDSELKGYFESHRDKFRKPETLTLSEVFLGTADKDDAEVLARARQIVAQLRGGADFATIARAQSEREDEKRERVAPKTGGKLGQFPLTDISNEAVVAALKPLKAGSVTDPVKTDRGYLILRVDERAPAGEAVYEERKVREAITRERMEAEHKTYLASLRRDAYVEIAPSYREAVLPLLKTEGERTVSPIPVASPAAKKDEKKKDKKEDGKKSSLTDTKKP